MKFGQTLEQRSVQQWRHYNLDYSTLKRLIKEHTDPNQQAAESAAALSIPGRGPSRKDAFDAQLLHLLARECERLDLFVKSKQYELNSRLGTVDRQIAQLKHRRQISSGSRNALGLQRRFANLETELLRVGEEIQNTSRFVATNRMAVQKLVKKHRKWTASPTLASQVEEQLLNRPTSFAKIDLSAVMTRYAHHLADLRSAFLRSTTPTTTTTTTTPQPTLQLPRSAHQPGSAASLHDTSPPGIDFDLDLSSTETATYWIHPDNVVELRVLLLQYTRHADLQPPSPQAQRQRRRSSVASGDADDCIGGLAFASPDLHARWAGVDAAVVLTDPARHLAKLHCNRLAKFLSSDNRSDRFSGDDSDTTEGEAPVDPSDHAGASLHARLQKKHEVTPLACVCAVRSRFVGFETGKDAAKAALDVDVRMDKTTFADMRRRDFFRASSQDSMIAFPHAVLTVSACDSNTPLLKALDSSHLTERVDDFSPEVHAIATCCQPNAFPDPSWMAKLSEDIRHLPPRSDPPSRKGSIRGLTSSSGRASPRDNSRSATTLTGSDGPMTPDAAVHLAQSRLLPLETHFEAETVKPDIQRYWNEYDHPNSENGDGEPFTLEFYPDDRPYAGTTSFLAWQRKLVGFFSSLKSHRTHDREHPDGSRRALLQRGRQQDPSPTTESSDEEEAALDDAARSSEVASPRAERRRQQNAALLRAAAFGQKYGTFSAQRRASRPSQKHPEVAVSPKRSLFWPSIALVSATLITLLMAALSMLSRRKAHPLVEIILLFGCAGSFLFEAVAFTGAALACGWTRGSEPSPDFAEQGLGLVIPAEANQTWMAGFREVGVWRLALFVSVALVVTAADITLVAWTLVRQA